MQEFNNFNLVDHPLIKRDLTILRDKDTDQNNFRIALRRVSSILAFEISKSFKVDTFEIETPLEKTDGYKLAQDIVLVPVLRAGLSMVNAFLEIIPEAKVGHIGIQRNEVTLEPVDYYYKTPKNIDIAKVILLDPMLATGGSGAAALNFLKKRGAVECIFACLVASPQGIKKIESVHPDVKVYSAALDRTLNDRGYILPGLGDAGDRTFGTL
ncbi:MAG: uracil phosphoribosyltransferase [Bacteroidota bacterium]|jgi:uracil phosphoribosyltransferase|nr:uracil phosphoribosyltransferase [Ignavibacteria bacterium]MCU7499853.1 uracil phosphoribosyltransferase [Ignavibacteria bacterium]MCU7511848.1 uracil phosphoribosyltransferase [Ignavibacteria bacterium]MCU7519951.1 uracil phosphoribosyltransferase [Ignavibacteria bacterium]MCU7523026.1 uracil phosphoribosyltransferase [Ignavibacteria bacterium]